MREIRSTPPVDVWSLDIDRAAGDVRLAAIDLTGCDLDGDGFIAGETEIDHLDTAIDQFAVSHSPDIAHAMQGAVLHHLRVPGYYTPAKKAMRIAGYASIGLSAVSLVLAPLIGLAPAALLMPIGSLLATKGGAGARFPVY